MISSLRGRVLAATGGAVVIEVGGVGLEVNTTPAFALACREGHEASVQTSLIVREDALTLFGFATRDELHVFELLIGVPGVGPKSPLGLLAVLPPDHVAAAVHADDDAVFRRVTGIGPKTAKLITVSLAGKLFAPEPGAGSASSTPPRASQASQSVLAALTGLGYPEKVAADAIERATVAAGIGAEGMPVAALLRASLVLLGPSHSGLAGAVAEATPSPPTRPSHRRRSLTTRVRCALALSASSSGRQRCEGNCSCCSRRLCCSSVLPITFCWRVHPGSARRRTRGGGRCACRAVRLSSTRVTLPRSSVPLSPGRCCLLMRFTGWPAPRRRCSTLRWRIFGSTLWSAKERVRHPCRWSWHRSLSSVRLPARVCCPTRCVTGSDSPPTWSFTTRMSSNRCSCAPQNGCHSTLSTMPLPKSRDGAEAPLVLRTVFCVECVTTLLCTVDGPIWRLSMRRLSFTTLTRSALIGSTAR